MKKLLALVTVAHDLRVATVTLVKGWATRTLAVSQVKELVRASELAVSRLDAVNLMLTHLQFSHGPGGIAADPTGKCPICLGWEGGPQGRGEVRGRHTEDCKLAALLRGES